MLALVTTVAVDPSTSREMQVLCSFLLYHLSVGFERIFVFLDRPSCSIAQVKAALMEAAKGTMLDDQVVFVDRASSDVQHPSCQLYSSLMPCLPNEVQARQQLNCELAMNACLNWNDDHPSERLEWLVHLDLDELLYFRNSLREFFASLNAASVDQFTFVNHEAVPTSCEISNYFVEATHFKVNHLVAPFTPAALASMNRWKTRTTYRQYMLAYDNGKSAVRIRRGITPASVHQWRNVSTWTNFADPRHLALGQVMPHSSSPWVLHYPNCGYEWFKAKYTLLGPFPDAWFGGKLPIEPCFHTTARGTWAACVAANDESAMRRLYETQVMLDDEAEMADHMQHGVCIQLTQPAERIASLIQSSTPREQRDDPLRPERSAVSTPAPLAATPVLTSNGYEPQQGYNAEKAWLLASIASNYLT